jgi:hypothetical protein
VGGAYPPFIKQDKVRRSRVHHAPPPRAIFLQVLIDCPSPPKGSPSLSRQWRSSTTTCHPSSLRSSTVP